MVGAKSYGLVGYVKATLNKYDAIQTMEHERWENWTRETAAQT
jgi:hypothetical protein